MDVLTHGLVGAALALSGARRHEARLAAGIGFVAGTAADLDVLIGRDSDPLLAVEYHRHFSHALAFIPVGALLAAGVLWPLLRGRGVFTRLYLFALLGYSASGLLDACTSYGTHLLWPFSNERVAFNIISIVDPIFTLALMAGVVISCVKRQRAAAWAALGAAGCYLLFGFAQHGRAEQMQAELARERGQQVERAVVKPTIGNLLLWRSVYQAGGRYHVDALRVGWFDWFGGSRVYVGGSLSQLELGRDLPPIPDASVLRADIERFAVLSDGFVVQHPEHRAVLGDVRYANEPSSLSPLWGIELDPARPEQHVRYEFFREVSASTRQRFLAMLLGREP